MLQAILMSVAEISSISTGVQEIYDLVHRWCDILRRWYDTVYGWCTDVLAPFNLDIFAYDPASPLLFNTGLFLLLFVAFLGVYHMLRRWHWVKLIAVILFSLYFYYKSSAECCFILLGVCVSDYLLGLLLGWARWKWLRVAVVTVNVIVNLGMLVYFKYFNLLIDTVNSFGTVRFDAMDIILPAGISFFTFRSISYIVDIYRGDMKPARNFLEYTFFLTFFPPLLAGPVVRARDMLPQIKARPKVTDAMTGAGFFLIMSGLIKKVVVADYISGNFVDRVFDNPLLYSGFENLMAAYGFTIQLYCDFSGYSDMAIGIALLLGYEFKANFEAPFKSQNPTEWWRRWHISLSTWLRDYLYIPMGGSRCSRTRANVNLFNTMLLGGLWHGASWMYVIWGAWNGVLLVVHKAFHRAMPRVKATWWRKAANVFLTFNLMALGFMFFRSRSLEGVGNMMHQILFEFHADVAPQWIEGYMLIAGLMLVAMLIHLAPSSWTAGLSKRYSILPLVLQTVILALVIFLVIQVRQSDLVPFIYLQY